MLTPLATSLLRRLLSYQKPSAAQRHLTTGYHYCVTAGEGLVPDCCLQDTQPPPGLFRPGDSPVHHKDLNQSVSGFNSGTAKNILHPPVNSVTVLFRSVRKSSVFILFCCWWTIHIFEWRLCISLRLHIPVITFCNLHIGGFIIICSACFVHIIFLLFRLFFFSIHLSIHLSRVWVFKSNISHLCWVVITNLKKKKPKCRCSDIRLNTVNIQNIEDWYCFHTELLTYVLYPQFVRFLNQSRNQKSNCGVTVTHLHQTGEWPSHLHLLSVLHTLLESSEEWRQTRWTLFLKWAVVSVEDKTLE